MRQDACQMAAKQAARRRFRTADYHGSRSTNVASKDFDELFEQAGLIARALRDAYKDVSGEELDLEAALKNYPLLIIGTAIGTGALAGWWIAHRRQPPEPSPPAKKKTM